MITSFGVILNLAKQVAGSHKRLTTLEAAEQRKVEQATEAETEKMVKYHLAKWPSYPPEDQKLLLQSIPALKDYLRSIPDDGS